MAAKDVVFSQSARQRTAYGLDVLANTVEVTLHPRGRNLILERGWNAPTVSTIVDGAGEAGVIDPTNVVRGALENAASVASLMLMTEALIAARPHNGASAGVDSGGEMV